MTTERLPEEERAVVATVRAFVDERVRPVARGLEHAGTYPADLIAVWRPGVTSRR